MLIDFCVENCRDLDHAANTMGCCCWNEEQPFRTDMDRRPNTTTSACCGLCLLLRNDFLDIMVRIGTDVVGIIILMLLIVDVDLSVLRLISLMVGGGWGLAGRGGSG